MTEPHLRRTLSLTVLDAAILALAASATVMVLNDSAPVSNRHVAVVFVACVALVLCRAITAWRVAPFPAMARGDGALTTKERLLLATPVRMTRESLFYAVGTAVGSTVWLWPHLLRLRDVPDRIDPIFSAWRLARFAHQLANDPSHLFDGNIFYPLPLTLTYSDAAVLQGLLGSPFIWMGVDPLIVSNLLFLVAFPACGLAFFYTTWRLTLDPGAACVAGLVGAWYPFHSEHYSHLELQWFMFVPLAMLALLRMIAQPGWSTGAIFGVAVGAQWLASMYLGTMLITFLIPFGLIVAIGWRLRPSWRLLQAALASVVLLLTACLVTGVPYLRSREVRGDRKLADLLPWSAMGSDYGATHRRLATYRWHSRARNQSERELFPGTSPLALAAVGVATSSAAVPVATMVAGAMAVDWSLGLNGLTYDELYEWALPYRGMRVPARFSVLVGSSLILLGAFGASAIFRRFPARGRAAMCLTVAALTLLDLRVTTPLVSYWSTIPGVYQRVDSDMVLAEFPVGREVDYMYFSTQHWARLIAGYSGFIPVDPELEKSRAAFPSADAIASLGRRGVTHITYNCLFERSDVRCRNYLQQLDRNETINLVASTQWYGAEVRLYRLP